VIAQTEREGREDQKNRGSDGAHATFKSGSWRQFNVLALVSPTNGLHEDLGDRTVRWLRWFAQGKRRATLHDLSNGHLQNRR